MKLTIESADSIDQVLAVVGALYKVELSVGAPASAPAATAVPDEAPEAAAPAPAARSSRRRAAATGRPAKRAASAPGPTADSAGIRAWARENGVTVSPRGRIPANVQQQYEAAQA